MTNAVALFLGGLILGAVVGVVGRVTHFCTMGAISDRVLFGSWRRLRAWALALAVALVGTQALFLVTGLDAGRAALLRVPAFWPGAPLGGLLFGVGMVLAGGCAYRNLVRAASGSLKGMTVCLVMAFVAWPASALVPSFGGPAATLPAFWPAPWRWLLVLLAAGALLFAALKEPRAAARREQAGIGLALGLAVPLGFALTGALGDEARSLAFVAPSRELLLWAFMGPGSWPGFGAALVLGTLVGAFLAGFGRGGFRVEGFASGADLGRHLLGAALMGFGGAVALGCTVGQGLSGLALLAPGALTATGGIVLGAVAALRFLLHGWTLGLPLPGGAGRGA
ncbi:MAG: YeeE/YedE family protein [Geminicoccaceae bacterium]|nr:YeeE/YedE family protein [Geminicoccaceae bacterium]